MPRPEDSGGPTHPRHIGCARVAFGSVKTLGVRNCHFEAVPALQGARSPLRPTGCSVYASPILFPVSTSRLRHGRKTRYGWVASPYPTGTFTLQETPSLSWRDNARRQARRTAGARHERTLAAVACTPLLGMGADTRLHLDAPLRPPSLHQAPPDHSTTLREPSPRRTRPPYTGDRWRGPPPRALRRTVPARLVPPAAGHPAPTPGMTGLGHPGPCRRGGAAHLHVLKHRNQGPEDQHSLPVIWWGATLPPIVRRCLG